jgi:hypothetical protein
LAQPTVQTWGEQPLRLVEQTLDKDDLDPKALACYGVLLSCPAAPDSLADQVWLRFVDGRPVSAITTQFLAWGCVQLAAAGKRVWLLIWDNASWHGSRAVRRWIQAHNRHVKAEGQGVRILVCFLPVKSPWLNRIEPKWMHTKRRVLEPDGVLSAAQLEARVCEALACQQHPHLAIPDKVA